ncbi:MAG: hypothetical protein HRT61_20780, partial [Ekhidna sp.]|nr:hypothetical protein [Ekhidna sp.]
METALLHRKPETLNKQPLFYFHSGNQFYVKGFLDNSIYTLNSLRNIQNLVHNHLQEHDTLLLSLSLYNVEALAEIALFNLFKFLKAEDKKGKKIKVEWQIRGNNLFILDMAKD